MTLAIVIPARMASTRFPGKPLVDLCGKPMLQWVYEAALASAVTDQVIVATPDQEILDTCARFGARAMLTSLSHPSGTDRIAEVAEHIEVDGFINVQGDEPLVSPDSIRACATALTEPSVQMSSLFAACSAEDYDNPNVVKVVTDGFSDALYFSRFAVPFPRNDRKSEVKKHIGLYGYTVDVLGKFKSWPVGELEQTESLEQLRFLENGIKIRMARGTESGIAVDTPEQAESVRALLTNETSQ